MLISTIFPWAIVKPMAATGRPLRARDESGSSVHERWLCEPSNPRERERLRGHSRGAANHLRGHPS
jgi:hypothetical protein